MSLKCQRAVAKVMPKFSAASVNDVPSASSAVNAPCRGLRPRALDNPVELNILLGVACGGVAGKPVRDEPSEKVTVK